MLWNVTAPFFRNSNERWIDDFVPVGEHRFHKVQAGGDRTADDWHRRASRATPIEAWRTHWACGRRALRGADGVVTVFPQLAVTTAIARRLSRRQVPVVAWCFNIGAFRAGSARIAARIALGSIERFVVHSTAEVELVADYLALPVERVVFVPLQRAEIAIIAQEERVAPFCLAMGSANRDYATLLTAARTTGLPLVIVAAPRSLEGLSVPTNVTVRSGLTPHECRILAQQARFSVVPLTDAAVASGQVTVIEAQRMARGVIASRTIGTVDYIDPGRTGLLVPPGDPGSLADAMRILWDDTALRDRLGTDAADWAAATLSDEAAGRALATILSGVLAGRA